MTNDRRVVARRTNGPTSVDRSTGAAFGPAAADLITRLSRDLRRLTEEGSSVGNNFLIIACNPARNFYVQFLSSVGSAVMRGEAVSDAYVLGGPLTDEQRTRLRELGWLRPTKKRHPNYWRRLPAISGRDFAVMAEVAVTTLQQVYGWNGMEAEFEVKIHFA